MFKLKTISLFFAEGKPGIAPMKHLCSRDFKMFGRRNGLIKHINYTSKMDVAYANFDEASAISRLQWERLF